MSDVKEKSATSFDQVDKINAEVCKAMADYILKDIVDPAIEDAYSPKHKFLSSGFGQSLKGPQPFPPRLLDVVNQKDKELEIKP